MPKPNRGSRNTKQSRYQGFVLLAVMAIAIIMKYVFLPLLDYNSIYIFPQPRGYPRYIQTAYLPQPPKTIVQLLPQCKIDAPERIKLAILGHKNYNCEVMQAARIVFWYESTDNPDAVNTKNGIYGGTQITLETWREQCTPRGYTNPRDVVHQAGCTMAMIDAGQLYDRWLRWWSPEKQRESGLMHFTK